MTRHPSDAIETFVPFIGQTFILLCSILLASAVFAVAPVTAGVGSFATTSLNTTESRPVEASRSIESAGCTHSQLAVGGPSVLLIRMVHLGKGAVVLTNVCIDGVGPFPFVVDSGSALSVVDTQLSHRFHLDQVGTPELAAGIGCSTTVVPEQVSRLVKWAISP